MSSPRSKKTVNLGVQIPGLAEIYEEPQTVRVLRTLIKLHFANEADARRFHYHMLYTPSYQTLCSAALYPGEIVQLSLRAKESASYGVEQQGYKPEDLYRALLKEYGPASSLIAFENQVAAEAKEQLALMQKNIKERHRILSRLPGFRSCKVHPRFGAPSLEVNFADQETTQQHYYGTIFPLACEHRETFTVSTLAETITFYPQDVESHQQGIIAPKTLDDVMAVLDKALPDNTSKLLPVERQQEEKLAEVAGSSSLSQPLLASKPAAKTSFFANLKFFCCGGAEEEADVSNDHDKSPQPRG